MSTLMKLKNVRNGTLCKHTGQKRIDRAGQKTRFLKTFDFDTDLVFRKLSNSQHQLVDDNRTVIFGMNDVVEVLK